MWSASRRTAKDGGMLPKINQHLVGDAALGVPPEIINNGEII